MIAEEPEEELSRFFESHAVPVLGHLSLTEECNQSCRHCYRAGLTRDALMPASEWIRLMGEFRAEGCFDLTFSGGEPFLHPQWREILEAAWEGRFRYEVMTNGTVAAARDLEFLLSHGCRQLHVSVHGMEAGHDRFTGLPGSFRRARAQVVAAVRLGLPVVVKMSVFRHNLHEAGRVAEEARALGAVFGPSYFILPRFAPGDDGFLAERLTPEEVRWFENRFPNWTDRRPFSACEDENGPWFCNMGWNRFAVGPGGDLSPCSQVVESVGNLKGRSFRELWRYSEALNRLRRRKGESLSACRDCRLLGACRFRCMGHFHQATGWYDRPAPDHCEITAAWMGWDGAAETREAVA